MRMAAQYELLKELLNSGTKLNFGQEFFYKFYQAFILKDRWVQYVQGVGTTLLVTAIALALGVVLGSVVALVRVAHDQQRSDRRNPVRCRRPPRRSFCTCSRSPAHQSRCPWGR